MSSTLIVYFLTVGVLLPPIVIFSFLLCGLASFDSNHLFFFLGILLIPPFFALRFAVFFFFVFFFLLFVFSLFAFLLLGFRYHATTKNH